MYNTHAEIAAAAAAYMEQPADLTHLRWFRRCWGFLPFPQTASRREQIADILHERVHVATITTDDGTNLDMDALWAEAVAEVTERETREELDSRLAYLTQEDGDPEQDTHVQHMREILGLIRSWRTGTPVPQRRIVGWSAAAERVGLQPSDLRARASRGHFPEREDEERAAYGQMNPVWSADTLDTWWERKPRRGPGRRRAAAR